MIESLLPGGAVLDADELEARWPDALRPERVAKRLDGVGGPCVVAGWALDLFRGKQSPPHDDLEIAVRRRGSRRFGTASPSARLWRSEVLLFGDHRHRAPGGSPVMSWRQVSTEAIHHGPFISVWRDAVLRPDGSAGAYEHVAADDGVRVVALDAQGRVILVEDDFYLQRRRVLHVPGGGCGGQRPRDAANRELEEETGLIADTVRPLGVIDPLPAITTVRTHLFLATGLSTGTQRRDDTEAGMTVERRTLAEAVEAVRTGVITDAGSVAALLLAAQAHP
ncbi:NUDIX domain-containing protein [Streptomyces hokutonensis]|uniref:NUDIX domain-containing protein n=1 Tax=Streptomyces hokutonensis TaxID=1306990 RepID=UPI0037FFF609